MPPDTSQTVSVFFGCAEIALAIATFAPREPEICTTLSLERHRQPAHQFGSRDMPAARGRAFESCSSHPVPGGVLTSLALSTDLYPIA